MHQQRQSRTIFIGIALIAGVAIAITVAAGPPSLVAQQSGTVGPAGSVVATPGPASTAPSASVVSGTAPAASVAVPTTDPRLLIPPVAPSSSGPSRDAVILTVIGVACGAVFVGGTGWGIVRMIGSTGKR